VLELLGRTQDLVRLAVLHQGVEVEHNRKIPHAAFDGQTPDEMYFGTGTNVADDLARQRSIARRDRIEANRAKRCVTCA